MKRGRPKGRSSDTRSFGPLGDLIRKHRLEKKFGLLDVAKAIDCSVQFVSNIEHGRAPLPWEKIAPLASYLKIQAEELQAANLAIRSDFKSFMANGRVTLAPSKSGKKSAAANGISLLNGIKDAASTVTFTARDPQLRELLDRYQSASPNDRKKFVKAALKMLPVGDNALSASDAS